MASEYKYREYVTAHDERLRSELRAKRKRGLKQVGNPLVDGFLEKVRLQDQQLPEYLKETRAQRLPRGGHVGAGPNNLPSRIAHAKAASASMAFPPPAYQGMYRTQEGSGYLRESEINERFGKN